MRFCVSLCVQDAPAASGVSTVIVCCVPVVIVEHTAITKNIVVNLVTDNKCFIIPPRLSLWQQN